MIYKKAGVLKYSIWIKNGLLKKLVPCPVYSIAWKAFERNKYAPWGRGEFS